MSGRKYCAREGCTDPVEAPGRRFCTPHRVEHGQDLLGQLRDAFAESDALRAQAARQVPE